MVISYGVLMKEMIKSKVEELLAKEYYCMQKELNSKGTIFSVNADSKQPYIKILAYKNVIVVCTEKNLRSRVKELLQDKNRDEIFEFPFVYGQTIHYVPNSNSGENRGNIVSFSDYRMEFLFEKDVLLLNGLTGFENSLGFDDNGATPTKAVYIAKENKKIIGVAGAAESSVEGIWEIGVDVVEEYRNTGLGSYLVSRLTDELLARNIVPFYSASVTNIASQRVAYRCGYIPLWVDTFGTILDGSSIYNDIVKGLLIE